MSKTASPKDAEKELDKPRKGFEVGQVTFADNGLTKSTITDINPETGAVSWKVTPLPGFDKLYDDLTDLVTTSKRVYVKTKDDKKFREIYDEIRVLRNKVRTHLRNEYPDEYKRMTMEGEVEEISTSGAAGAYNTPYAFKKKKKKSKYKMKMPSGMVSSLGYTMDEGKLGDGADLGPGPKAGPDGVTDSAYTKQFKYKLVPKNKNGTYVQKGAGMIVKKLY